MPTSSPWKWRSSSAPTTPAFPAACINALVRSRRRRGANARVRPQRRRGTPCSSKGSLGGTADWAVPVSYTHLEVYKRQPRAWPPSAPATRATPSRRSSPPTRTTPMRTARSPWPAPWIPTPPARSSTCAWAPSTTWTPARPCSARPSRVRTSSASCAPAMSSSPSSSRTPPSKYRPARGVGARRPSRLTSLPRRLSGRPECRVKEVYEQRVIRSSK